MVSEKLDFQLGYFVRSEKKWINNSHDLKDAFGQLKSSGKLTLWCTNKVTAGGKRTRGNVSESDNELCGKHQSAYSMVQYRLWAKMIIAKTHESTDEAPNVPMFGGKRPRGKVGSTGELSEALTGMAQTICNALSPKVTPSVVRGHGAQPSPTKIVELRSKYMQQLSELVKLKEIGALTTDEYEEQRTVIVKSMRKLKTD